MIIKQYNITSIDFGSTMSLSNSKLGISISKDDYFSYRPFKEEYDSEKECNPYITLGNKGFYFYINDEPVYIGLTEKYESDDFFPQNTILRLPPRQIENDLTEGLPSLPKSLLIQIVTKEKKENVNN